MERWGVYIVKWKQWNSLYLFHFLFLTSGAPVLSSPAIKALLSFSSSHLNFPFKFNDLVTYLLLKLHFALLQGSSIKMGLSPYSNPSDAGVLCVILVKTAMSISFMKEILRSILHAVGIRVTSWEEFSDISDQDSVEIRGSPSTTYMEEFRSRTPTLRYDSLLCLTKQECSVCLIEFKPDAEINRLSCGHVFHKSCLEKWLNYWNITCPLCRNHMMSPKETLEISSPM